MDLFVTLRFECTYYFYKFRAHYISIRNYKLTQYISTVFVYLMAKQGLKHAHIYAIEFYFHKLQIKLLKRTEITFIH